jgi:hypothetical protein
VHRVVIVLGIATSADTPNCEPGLPEVLRHLRCSDGSFEEPLDSPSADSVRLRSSYDDRRVVH